MCQAPSPELQKLLHQLNSRAAKEAVEAKNRLMQKDRADAREQLLRIQLEMSRKFPK